jgi:hypothetical protein
MGRFHTLRLAERPPPGMSAKDALIPTSPRKRGKVKAVLEAIALACREEGRGRFDAVSSASDDAGRRQ